MCCQVRCPSLRTRPEQGRAQLRDQEITTCARLSSHAMHRSQPSQGSSDHLEASVGLRLRSLPLEPGQDRTKPSKAMFVKKCDDRKNMYTMPRRKGKSAKLWLMYACVLWGVQFSPFACLLWERLVIKPRASGMLGKCYASELHPQHQNCIFFFLKTGRGGELSRRSQNTLRTMML